MAIRIVSNRKLDLTDEEFLMYQEICQSYNRPNFAGSQLFDDLFESDKDGIITLMRPPSKKYSSMEVVCFVMMLFQQQHVRLFEMKMNKLLDELKEKANSTIAQIKPKP